MSVNEVLMYRLVCDEPGCDRSAQDDSEYFAWSNPGPAIDEAVNGDWTIRPGLDLCSEHGGRTVCMGNDEECPRRDVTEAPDGWMYCPDHFAEGVES